jgi:cytochrome c biogenesis protein CcmG/thiol:disulfide interchange protein DsbE
MKNLRFLLPLGLFAVLTVFFYIGLGRNPAELPSQLIGKPAPAFALASIEDPARIVSSADYRGRMYLFNVWGSWCPTCREEHEALLAIAQTHTVPIIGLDWNDERSRAQSWLRQLGNPYTAVAFDADGRTAIDWGVTAAPETFLVSADGRVLYKHISEMTLDVWEREFLPRIRARSAGNTP